MASVFTAVTKLTGTGRHDIRGRIDPLAGLHCFFQYSSIAINVILGVRQRSQFVLQKLPRLNLIEKFEQNRAEEDFCRRLVTGIDDVADQVLADTVRCPIRVGEFETIQDLVRRKWILPCDSPKEDRLAFRSKPPIRFVDLGRLNRGHWAKNIGNRTARFLAALFVRLPIYGK